MTVMNKQGLMMDNWHKCPNILTDKLVGQVISPNAGWVVLTVWRLTDGVRGRSEALIPTEKFMSILDTDRDKTAYKYVKEAIQSGLINVKKSRGKVNTYSINKKCDLWYDVEAVAEKDPTTYENEVVAKSASSGEKCHTVGAKSATTYGESRGEKRHSYKDIKTKDNIKEKKIETAVVEKPKPLSKKQQANLDRKNLVNDLFAKWLELSGQRITASKKRLSHINARLDDGFSKDDIIEAMTYVATDKWHVENGHSKIEIAIRSVEQLENKLIAARAAAKRPAPAKPQSTYNQSPQTRATDPLAVNAKWGDDQSMTDEEKRAWAGTPIPFCSNSDSDDQNSFDFNASQGVMEI